MNIYELRKIASRNKKYKYLYELIKDGQILDTRRSNIEYVGCLVNDQETAGFYFKELKYIKVQIAIKSKLALTFDTLLSLSNLQS